MTKPNKTNFSVISPTGWGVFILGACISVIQMANADNVILGCLYFLGIMLLTIGACVIASLIFPSSNDEVKSEVSTKSMKQMKKPTYSTEKVYMLKCQILQMKPINEINDIIQQIPSDSERRATLRAAYDMALGEICNQSEISLDVQDYIKLLEESFSLDEDGTNCSNNHLEYVKKLIVQDILNGKTPNHISLSSPINMQAGEIPIWPFMNVVCYEEVTKRAMVGASRGINIRIAKGIYYKVGAFKGEPLVTSSLQAKYTGSLILTNKNVYFYSVEKVIRFPYGKIISFIPFKDAIGIQPDRTNAKPVYFKELDGNFAFKIVSNINKLG